MTDDDFSVLTARDRRRLSEVEADLAALGPAPERSGPTSMRQGMAHRHRRLRPTPTPVSRRMSRIQVVGIVACCALIIVGVVILVDHALSNRLPGQASSGSITQDKARTIEQQARAGIDLDDEGKLTQSLALYNKVLAEDPTDPTALAESGWLEWNAGTKNPSLKVVGELAVRKAVDLAPNYYEAHLFLGLILYYQYDRSADAVAQFNKFLADDPPGAEVQAAAGKMTPAYKEAGVAPPAALTSPSG